jgi:hypothetical protein
MHEWDINRVVQIILEGMHRVERDYNDRIYHRDITQRPHLRPTVPTPPTKSASEEDQEIAVKIHNVQHTAPPLIQVDVSIIKATRLLDQNKLRLTQFDRVFSVGAQ